jgi:hypothetical protein
LRPGLSSGVVSQNPSRTGRIALTWDLGLR